MHKSDFANHYVRCWDESASPASIGLLPIEPTSTLSQAVTYARESFENLGLDASEIQVLLATGTHAANGHAFLGATATVWLSDEEDWTDVNAAIFVAHEMAHAVHYGVQRAFYFDTLGERTNFNRQLIAEGLATVVTMLACNRTLDVSLWADYLSSASRTRWIRSAEEREQELRSAALRSWDSQDEAPFLYTNSLDVWHNRGGYYIGARAILSLMARKSLSLASIFALDRNSLEELVRFELNSGLPLLADT